MIPSGTAMHASQTSAHALVRGTPPPPRRRAARPPLAVTIVRWRIRRGMEDDFLEHWATRVPVADRSGLVGEFLCEEGEAAGRFPWVRWADRSTDEYTVFLNVGLWRDGSDFEAQVGGYVDVDRPPLPFEWGRRERVVVEPVEWRRGPLGLPEGDAPGVV